jgi:hypothetical protein
MPEGLVLQNAIKKQNSILLTPSQKALGIELVLTAQNAKVSLSAELQSEFVREFQNESPELLERVFRAWRRRSKFMPAVSEIYDLLEQTAESYFQERQAEKDQADQADRNAARRYWNEHPEVRSEVTRLSKALEEKLSMSRIREIHQEPPRSPRNVLALSQSKVLGKIPLPPKKQPHPITDTSAEWVKVAKAAKG